MRKAAWLQAVAAMYMKSAVLWDITQCIVVTPYRRFGTNYQSNINKNPTWCKLCSLIYFTAKSLYMFRVSHHPSPGVLKTVTPASGTGYNIGTATSFQCGQVGPGSGRNVLILLASCQQTCMTYTIVVCTVKNSWWWTKELSETCRVLFLKYIWEISASSWFYYKNCSSSGSL